MKIGTKSVLYGAHCFFIHPIFVFIAWWNLYGFPFDPRLWVAFIVHDIGYIGKPNMDGEEGETHVELGAKIMGVFGKRWADFSRYHSRFYAKRDGVNYSKLCVADKLAICLEPSWLYLPRVILSGEVHEYIQNAVNGKYQSMNVQVPTQKEWFLGVKDYLFRWVEEHKEIKEDTWTPKNRAA
jgi:hypothetical protein